MSNKYYQIGYVTKDEMFDIAIVEASRDCIAKTWFVEYNSWNRRSNNGKL